MKEVPLRGRRGTIRAYALVDDEDFEVVDVYRWRLHSGGYVVRHPPMIGGARGSIIYLHRELLSAPKEIYVDHVNLDKLDNRRTNLRLATEPENAQNQRSRGGSSRFRGVTWDKRVQRWKAQVGLNYRCHNLGHFDTEEAAARVAAAFRAAHMPFSQEALLR